MKIDFELTKLKTQIFNWVHLSMLLVEFEYFTIKSLSKYTHLNRQYILHIV